MQRLNDYGIDGVFTNYADKYKNLNQNSNTYKSLCILTLDSYF